MATTTENLGLTKPDAAEGYDINVFNANADAIDQFAGEMRQMLGGAGGGLGDKVDTLLQNVAAVKTDTEALASALASANQSIATLLSRSGSVKTVYNGTANTSQTSGVFIFTIPASMNANNCIVYVGQGISWSKNGATVTLSAAATGQSFTFQIIEFY